VVVAEVGPALAGRKFAALQAIPDRMRVGQWLPFTRGQHAVGDQIVDLVDESCSLPLAGVILPCSSFFFALASLMVNALP